MENTRRSVKQLGTIQVKVKVSVFCRSVLVINICRSVLDPNFLPLDFKEFFIAVDNQRGYVAFEIEAVITENLNQVKLS